MKVKQRSDDFRVRELLAPDVLAPRGAYRVYRVIKSKLTSFEAARALAGEAGANAGDVSMCGLKDRQGVTLQHMALRHGPQVSVRSPELRIETAGFASEPLDSKASEGNAFEIVLRGLSKPDVDTLRANAHTLKDRGLINYFDEQRFGNLRHGQGWIVLDLLRGKHEDALRALLTSRSPHDDRKAMAFKRALTSYWGDWTACRDIAGKFGEHHSVFEHLKREPGDFAGAFYHLASRLRLIHLYAYQSHLWNRAVAEFVRARVQPAQRVVIESAEGPLVYPEIDAPFEVAEDASFRLPGPKLADVTDREQFDLLADALAHDQLVPAQFVIEGVSGFALKGEDRPLLVHPRHLRLRPARPDALNSGALAVEARFELPRGAYATAVVRRLLETSARRSAVEPPRTSSSAPQRGPRKSPAPRRPDPDADLLANVKPASGSSARGPRKPGRAPYAERGGPRSAGKPAFRRERGVGDGPRRAPDERRERAPWSAPKDGERRSGPRERGGPDRRGRPGAERRGPPRDAEARQGAGPRSGPPSGPRADAPKPLANWRPKPASGARGGPKPPFKSRPKRDGGPKRRE